MPADRSEKQHRCFWCSITLAVCGVLRDHQRKCCPDCEHPAPEDTVTDDE